MDIFTTQLSNVRQTPIKPNKLRVKSLQKDAKARSLNEEKDHLSGETSSSDLHIHQYQHDDDNSQSNNSPSENSINEDVNEEGRLLKDLELKEREGTAVKEEWKNKKDPDENPHIDLFV